MIVKNILKESEAHNKEILLQSTPVKSHIDNGGYSTAATNQESAEKQIKKKDMKNLKGYESEKKDVARKLSFGEEKFASDPTNDIFKEEKGKKK